MAKPKVAKQNTHFMADQNSEQVLDARPSLSVAHVKATWELKKPASFASAADAFPFIGKQVVVARDTYKDEFSELKYVGKNDVIVGDGYTVAFSQVCGWEGTDEEKAYHTALENA
jgi:hypothetical protein